jgi:predicted HD phosphohydrolase
MTSPVDRVARLFAGEGLRSYLGEKVNLATHMLQAGALAEASGAAAHLVAAALLHDVGHFEEISGERSSAGNAAVRSLQGVARSEPRTAITEVRWTNPPWTRVCLPARTR